MADTVLRVENLSVSYHGIRALEDISFSINGEGIVGILGPNGAGKTTLMKAILGLIPVEMGSVRIWGRPVADTRRRIAYVPQRSNIDMDFPVTVEDVVMMGRYVHLTWWGRPRIEDVARVERALEQVGMLAYRNRQVGELSGGQQQRVFLARALAGEADLLFLDEPFAAIDIPSENIIMDILQRMSADGKTALVIHHDLNKAEKYFDNLLLLNRKLIAYGKKNEVLNLDCLRRAFDDLVAFTPASESGLMVVNA